MLSPADADLVRRDPALPGLGTLLAPETFRDELAAAENGWDFGQPEVGYVRYKPSRSCLVGYRIPTADGIVHLTATAYHRETGNKIAKAMQRPGRISLHDRAIVVSRFPDDDGLNALPWLASADARRRLLEKIVPGRSDLWNCDLEPLRYKPERRFVARLVRDGVPCAVLKAYARSGYGTARKNAKAFRPDARFHRAARLGRSTRYGLLALEYVHGRLLTEALGDPTFEIGCVAAVGRALAAVHEQRSKKLRVRSRFEEASGLLPLGEWLAFVAPHLASRAQELAGACAARIEDLPPVAGAVHGDFYAKQVLLGDDGTVGLIDFDEAFSGDPAHDLGTFLAHLERDGQRNMVSHQRIASIGSAFLDGYAAESRRPLPEDRLALCTAAALLRLAAHPFRHREPEWLERTAALLDRAETLLQRSVPAMQTPVAATVRKDISVSDPFAAAADLAMPFLPAALDPRIAERALHRTCAAALQAPRQLSAIRVVRHKQGRRCVVEYEFTSSGHDRLIIVGKARAKGVDRTTQQLQDRLRGIGFDDDSADGVSVPMPLGVVPDWHMGLHRYVEGVSATAALVGNDGVNLSRRLAEAIHKLHRVEPAPARTHTTSDEIAILERLLSELAFRKPKWERRLARLLAACRRVAAGIPMVPAASVHRDFYPDQVIVSGSRLYLLDLDLFCAGDPALDAGNVLGHLTEFALRTMSDPRGLADREEAFEDRFVELTGAACRPAVRAYAHLTLARHVALCARFPERRHNAETLLELCEDRMSDPGDHGATRRVAVALDSE